MSLCGKIQKGSKMDSTKVNWNELAQDALECGKQAVGEITTLVKGIAPEVWEMCVRQAYVSNAIPVLAGLAIIFFGVTWRLSFSWFVTEPMRYRDEGDEKRNYTTSNWDDWDAWRWIPAGIVFVIGAIMVCINISFLVAVFINPNYYAIQEFFKMIGGN